MGDNLKDTFNTHFHLRKSAYAGQPNVTRVTEILSAGIALGARLTFLYGRQECIVSNLHVGKRIRFPFEAGRVVFLGALGHFTLKANGPYADLRLRLRERECFGCDKVINKN